MGTALLSSPLLPPPSLSDPLPPFYPHLLPATSSSSPPPAVVWTSGKATTTHGLRGARWFRLLLSPCPVNVFQFPFPSSPHVSFRPVPCAPWLNLHDFSLPFGHFPSYRSSPYHYLAIGQLIVKEVLKVQKAAGEGGTKRLQEMVR